MRPTKLRHPAPPKREFASANDVASAVHARVSPGVAAALAGTKLSLLLSVVSLLVAITALVLGFV
jgi:hypothetical protein